MDTTLLEALQDLELDYANAALKHYYEGIQNISIANIVPLADLLKSDVRLAYGVFIDFFSWYGYAIDCNENGYAVYILPSHEDYIIPERDWLYKELHGDFYAVRMYPLEIPHNYKSIPLQYTMYRVILHTMQFLNTCLTPKEK